MSGGTVGGVAGLVVIGGMGEPAPVADDGVGASGATELLPDPVAQLAISGDPGAMVAALIVQTSKDERDVSRQVERNEEQIQDRQERAQVQSMHDKASDMRAEAWASGAAGVVEGGLALAGSMGTVESSKARAFTAGSKLLGVARDVGGKVGEAANQDTEANVTQHAHDADHAKRAASEAYDDVRDAKKLLDTALDFYREYSTASDQAKAAATHRG